MYACNTYVYSVNLSNTDPFGTKIIVLIGEIFLFQGRRICMQVVTQTSVMITRCPYFRAVL